MIARLWSRRDRDRDIGYYQAQIRDSASRGMPTSHFHAAIAQLRATR